MNITYTTYDLEADLPGVLEHVRKGKTVNIACDGEIFAELRPIERRKHTTEERLEELRQRGIIVSSGKTRQPFELGEPSPGALARFLADRNE
jgi:antitoxin (DNA-binding transcriptional repressor) of toxin-antitoxin stability system